MSTQLLLLFCFMAHISAEKHPDVTCLVMNLEYVNCTWNGQGIPNVNYNLTSWFYGQTPHTCSQYWSENNTNIGCERPYENVNRFHTFTTLLQIGNETVNKQDHQLKERVILNPPTNLTVKKGSDFNLWYYWNQTKPRCVESEVRLRKNDQPWEKHSFDGKNNFCVNLPSNDSRYEFQVRSKINANCGKSIFWSDWSVPVFWGSNNSTASYMTKNPTSLTTTVVCVMGAIIILILLAIMLVHHERIIFIPVVPKPSLISRDIEDWFLFPKNLKVDFKVDYDERACPVREYPYNPQFDSESSGISNLSGITDQTDCSVTMAMNDPDDPYAPFNFSNDSSE